METIIERKEIKLKMNYEEHYNKLIYRAQNRLLEGYSERHHIIPRCMNGDDRFENIVNLTPEEHYVAHQLLVKIYPKEYKLTYAVHRMVGGKFRNNKMYGWIRRKHAAIMSNLHKGKTPWNKGKVGVQSYDQIFKANTSKRFKGVPKSENHKKKISKALKHKPKNYEVWNKGIARSEETKRKISETKSSPVIINGIQYNSRREAANICGVTYQTIGDWIKKGKAQNV